MRKFISLHNSHVRKLFSVHNFHVRKFISALYIIILTSF
nr:MAG TPA: hypothetical protein [Caudoviricetes sp.]